METKEKLLQKRLIKTAIILLILVGGLGAAGLALSYYDDTTQTNKANAQSKNDSIHAEHDSLNTSLGKQFEMAGLFESYSKNHNTDLLINREEAPKFLKDLREQNHLTTLGIDVSPTSDVAGDAFTLKTGIMIKHEVKLQFGVLSDASAYNFIEGMQRTFPGAVYVHSLKLTRKVEITKDGLIADIGEHKITPAIEGEIEFMWIGTRPKPAEDPAAANRRFRGPGNE